MIPEASPQAKYPQKIELPVVSLTERSAVTNAAYSDVDFLRECTTTLDGPASGRGLTTVDSIVLPHIIL